VDAENVEVVTLKRAEDGNGLIVRLVEIEGEERVVRVKVPGGSVLHAYETNLVEENQRLLQGDGDSIAVTVKPFGLTTLRAGASLG
jgi:alpha-mannosidase